MSGMKTGWYKPVLAVMLLSTPIAAVAAEREFVPFPSLDKNRTQIRGEIFRPPSPGPYAAIVMMSGCSGLYGKSGRMKTNAAAWAGRFTNWGYLVLAVDGFTPRGFRSMCTKRKRPLHPIKDRPFDAYGGLAWLSKQPFVDPDRIALVGWSNGAMATLSAIRKNRVAKYGGNLRFRTAAAFYPGCITLTRYTKGKYRPYAPLLTFVGLADDWTFPGPCLKLMKDARKAGEPVEIIGYEGAYHAFDHPSLKLRTRTARNSRWKTRVERKVHIGSNPVARARSKDRLKDWLATHLGN
jgi:dienelactone hydrolase